MFDWDWSSDVCPSDLEEIYCFAGNPLDRASERRRDTAWIGELLADPNARLLPLRELRPLTRGSDALQLDWQPLAPWRDRKSTRLNSSHSQISYAVFCV